MVVRRTESLPNAQYFINAQVRQPPFSLPELRQLQLVLTRMQQTLSAVFVVQGVCLLAFAGSVKAASVCNAATFSGALGVAAASASTWALKAGSERRLLTVLHLFASILAAVASLIQVVVTGVYLNELLETATSATTVVFYWVILLAAVAQGVGFIFSAAFICFSWEHQRTRYNLEALSQVLQPILALRVTHTQASQRAFVDLLV